MLVPRARLPAGALTICPACLQAKDEEFARRANASSQKALRESCCLEEKTNVVEPKIKKKASKRQPSSVSALLCLTKNPLQSKIFREKTSHSEAKKRKKENTKPHDQGISKRAFQSTKLFPRKARLQLAAAAKQGTNGCARIENPSREMPCRDPGSSRGPSDLQSDALPTELSRLCAMPQMLVTPVGHRVAIMLIWGPHG